MTIIGSGTTFGGRAVEMAGLEPEAHGVPKGYDPGQLPDNSGQEPPYLGHTQKVGAGTAAEKRTLPATPETKRDVRSVQHACNGQGADLEELVALWPGLPQSARTPLLSMARDAANVSQP